MAAAEQAGLACGYSNGSVCPALRVGCTLACICVCPEKLPPPQEYAAYLRELMKRSIAHPTNPDAPLTGFKIVVDPGNGGGAFIADQVLGRMDYAALSDQLRCRCVRPCCSEFCWAHGN